MKKDVVTYLGNKILGRIPQDKRDRVILILIGIFAILAIVDFFVVDPLPLVDEIILPVIAFLLAEWYAKRKIDCDNKTIISIDEPNEK